MGSPQIITTIPIYRNSRLGLAGRGINFKMIKVNNKSGGPDTRHLITRHQPTSGVYPIHRFNGNNKPTYHGLGNPTQNRPCPFVSWSRDHRVKLPQNGPTIRHRKSTNTQAYNEWITTDTSHKHNRRRDGRRAKSNNDGTATKKKTTHDPLKKKKKTSQLIPHANSVRKIRPSSNVWDNTVAVSSEGRRESAKKKKKQYSERQSLHQR